MSTPDDMQTDGQIAELCERIFASCVKAGWYSDINTGEPIERNKGEQIALMHSELSEALEYIRKGGQDKHLPHRLGVEVELADACIRIFDFAGANGLDLEGAILEKWAYNLSRADHQIENRRAPGGKAI